LAVEVEDLGIAAGVMDRAVQAFGAPVLVDGDDARPVIAELPGLVIAWRTDAASPSHGVHGPLRSRFDAGEPEVVAAMTRLAALGRQAAAALEGGDHDALADCVRATWAERCGLGIVGPETAAMVETLEHAGVAATSAGSGGAVVGVLLRDDDAEAAHEALADCERVVQP
jgi:glucuronokinase